MTALQGTLKDSIQQVVLPGSIAKADYKLVMLLDLCKLEFLMSRCGNHNLHKVISFMFSVQEAQVIRGTLDVRLLLCERKLLFGYSVVMYTCDHTAFDDLDEIFVEVEDLFTYVPTWSKATLFFC